MVKTRRKPADGFDPAWAPAFQVVTTSVIRAKTPHRSKMGAKHRLTWVLCVTSMFLLAGCTSPAKPDERRASPTPAPGEPTAAFESPEKGPTVPSRSEPPLQETFWINGSMDAMLLHAAGTINDHGTFWQHRPFETLTATLTWTSPDGRQDLDAALVAPEHADGWHTAQAIDTEGWHVNRAGVPGLPDQPSSVALDRTVLSTFDDCGSCEWSAWALTKGGAVKVSYALRIDVTYVDPGRPAGDAAMQ